MIEEIDYGSICSGIESASLAWECLGFKPRWFAEIEPFPSAVLAHRWPATPNLGDMTKLALEVLLGNITAPLILVGGTPCQAFSVAGMRAGLADHRGALTIKYVELADAVDHVRPAGDECVVVWENVPGVLSDKGNAFGCFLGALVGESDALQPSGGKWTDAGCVYGPRRTAAWRVLDAQYFGLAQRRRRVFVVASARADFDPAAVLFEREGVRRDHPPRRGEGQDVTAGTLRSTNGGSDVDHARAGQLQPVAFGGGLTSGPVEVAACLVAKGQKCDFEVETFCVHGTQDPCVSTDIAHALGRNSGQENAVFAIQDGAMRENPNSGPQVVGVQADIAYTLEARASLSKTQAVCVTGEITHTLKAEGFDGSEDGTGRGQPIVATTGGGHGSTKETDTAQTLRALREAVGAEAFTQWGLGVLDSLQSPEILRQDLHGCSVRCEACEGETGLDDGAPSCPQAGSAGVVCQMREAGRQRRAPQGRQLAEQLAGELRAHLSKLPYEGASTQGLLFGMWQASEGLRLLRQALSAFQEMGRSTSDETKSAQRSAVRRLTPREAERLQGFPDDWTLIPWRGKPAEECPDGPRYKAIGNSKAVPVVRWIGRRIKQQLEQQA